jgi:hypothetical protein
MRLYVSFVYNKIRGTENESKYCKYLKPINASWHQPACIDGLEIFTIL